MNEQVTRTKSVKMTKQMTIPKREYQILNLFLVALIGPSFLFGGMIILIATLVGMYLIWILIRNGVSGSSGAVSFFAIICTIYYLYFGWRAHDQGIDARASRFFVENVAFIFVALFALNIEKVSVSKILRFAGNSLFPAMLVLLIVTLVERHIYDVARVEALSRSPLILATLIASGVHICLADWRARGTLWRSTAAASWLMGLYIILILTESRASFLVYIICGGIFLCDVFLNVSYGWKRNITRFLSLLIAVVACAVIVVIALFYLNALPRLDANISFLTGQSDSIDYSSASRIEMWRLGLEQAKSSPLFGFGPQNTFASIKENWPYDTDHGHLHSDILNHLVGGGLIGLVIYLVVIFSPIAFVIINKNRDNLPIYICVLTTSLLFFGGLTARMFLRPIPIVNSVFLLFFALAITIQFSKRQNITD